jgi:hypothetical protein
MNQKELDEVLKKHDKWLFGDEGGERANLRSADLTDANLARANLAKADLTGANLARADLAKADLPGASLRSANLTRANLRSADLTDANLARANLIDADLTGADIDFSCWPLWCGSVGVKVDARIAYQLAAHVCAVDCDDPEVQDMQRTLAKWAAKSYRAKECRVKRWLEEE